MFADAWIAIKRFVNGLLWTRPRRCALTEPSTVTAAAAPVTGTAGTVEGDPADLVGLLAVVGAGLLPVLYSSELYYRAWAPKAAMCLVLLGPGLVLLLRMVVARYLPALFAVAFVVAAALSTALSDNRVLSLVGSANWGTGLLFVGTLAGAWSLGSFAGERRRRQLLMAIVAAAILNAFVVWLQARGLVPPALEDDRPATGGRAGGLLGNPVHLGAMMAGGLWLVGRRFGHERRSWWWLVPAALVAGGAELSGGRAAVGLAALAVLASLPGAGLRRAAALLTAVTVGVVLAPVGAEGAVLGSARVGRPPPAVVNELADDSAAGKIDTRLAVWKISAGALAERPVVGWGPGRFEAATAPRYDAESAQEGGVFNDAHNWIVEYGITTGLLGLLLLLAWLGTSALNARGPLAGFALIIGASSLVEPLTVGVTPVALLALGASGPVLPSEWSGVGLARGWKWLAGVSLVVGLVAGSVLVVGQVLMEQGRLNGSPRQVQRGVAMSPPWPEVASLAARVESFYGVTEGEPHRTRTLELARRAVRWDPADPAAWAYLGFIELTWGTDSRAAEAFRESLERNPWGSEGLRGSVLLAERRQDAEALDESCRRLRILNRAPAACRAGDVETDTEQ